MSPGHARISPGNAPIRPGHPTGQIFLCSHSKPGPCCHGYSQSLAMPSMWSSVVATPLVTLPQPTSSSALFSGLCPTLGHGHAPSLLLV